MTRFCNGGPHGTTWCGKKAEFIATDDDGRLQWFCCEEHTEGATTQPIRDWFKEIGIEYDGEPER